MSPLLERSIEMERHSQRADDWGNFLLGVGIGIALFVLVAIDWT